MAALTPELTELTQIQNRSRNQDDSQLRCFPKFGQVSDQQRRRTLVKKADSTELVDATLTHPSITSAQRPRSRNFTDEEKAKLGQCIKTALVEKKDRFPVIVTEQVGTTVKSRSEEIVKIWNEYSWFKTLTQSGFSQLVDRVKKVVGVRKIYDEIMNEWATEVMTEVLELGGKDIITVTNDHIANDITATTDKSDLRKRGPLSTESTEPAEPSAIVKFVTYVVLRTFLSSIPLLYYSMAVLSAASEKVKTRASVQFEPTVCRMMHIVVRKGSDCPTPPFPPPSIPCSVLASAVTDSVGFGIGVANNLSVFLLFPSLPTHLPATT
ncbi:hypothetical protein HK102_011167 [Quaeritorhiza haematococci]|nr:hypothetical protein HK102_011167 [Quaeritorhiza haematococci]